MTISTQANETPFPWEQWEKLPKVEREAEMKEAIKESQQAEDLRQQIINRGGDPDLLTGETVNAYAVGNSNTRFIDDITLLRFSNGQDAETDVETEAVGGHFFDTAEGDFNSIPQILSPLFLGFALVTDAYQQQDAPGADLIAGEANQGMDSYQAQGGRYEVLA